MKRNSKTLKRTELLIQVPNRNDGFKFQLMNYTGRNGENPQTRELIRVVHFLSILVKLDCP